jgi:4-amino-4-deoxy-L-arabinose transferase-like glycosyltransferase
VVWVRLATAGVFAAYTAALVWQARVTGITYDEPAHLASAYLYWRGEDRLRPADAPPLTRLVPGWVPLALGAPLNTGTEEWRWGEQWAVGIQMFDAYGAEGTRRMMFLSRLTMLVFPLALLGVFWAWARELFGPAAALAATALLALEPNLLAHGSLIKSDVPAATGLLALAYAVWRYWRRPDRSRFWLLAIVAALAIQTKFTVQAAFPLAVLALALRHGLDRTWKAGGWRIATMVAVAYLTAAALNQFVMVRIHSPAFAQLADDGHWDEQERAAWRYWPPVPVPERWTMGVSFIRMHSRERGFASYFMGEYTFGGDPLYFPATIALKLPIPLQALVLAGFSLFAWRLVQGQQSAEETFLWIPTVLLFAMAMQSKINIGYRHVMPLTPLMFLGAIIAARELWTHRAIRLIALAGGLWLAAESARIYPYGISYFNQWAGGPNNGWRYLADSNNDWGQDWPQVARYAEEHGVEEVEFSYFGLDRPWFYMPGHQVNTIPTPFCGDCVAGPVFTPKPGFYAISANMLLGYFWEPKYHDYFRYFRERQPDAKAGYSIFLYDLR